LRFGTAADESSYLGLILVFGRLAGLPALLPEVPLEALLSEFLPVLGPLDFGDFLSIISILISKLDKSR
jgi:hypothetical protein